MRRLPLSDPAQKMVDKLIKAKESEKIGHIAAIDPQTGEAYYGKNVIEASKVGRKQRRDPKAVFFFVRIGYPSVHVLKYRCRKNREWYIAYRN